MRGQTKLTLGEFYSMSDSSSVSSHNTTKDVTSPKPRPGSDQSAKQGDRGSLDQSPRSAVYVPSDPGDDVETHRDGQEQTDTPCQGQESPQKGDSSSSSSPTSMVSESSLKKRIAENIKSTNGGVPFKPIREFSFRRKPATSRPAMPVHVITNPVRESSKPPSGRKLSSGDRSHTMFISKSPASHFSLPRERSFVSKQSMAIVDYQELCTGSIFDNQGADVSGPVTPQHGNSACSSRMELLTPAGDLELQEILGNKTPEKLPRSPNYNLPPSASDTPSTLARQMRTRELMGSGDHTVTYTPTLTTPSPANGVFYSDMVHNNPPMGLTRSRTLLGSFGRGTPKFYRKPGLPGARGAKGQAARQATFVANSFQAALGGKSHSTDSMFGNPAQDTNVPSLDLHSGQYSPSKKLSPRSHSTRRPINHAIRAGFSTPPAPSNKHQTTEPLTTSGRLRGIHSQPEPIHNGGCPLGIGSLLGGDDVTKRKAMYSSASSWRKRSNTVLGAPGGKQPPSSTLTQNTVLNGVGSRLNSDIHLNNSSRSSLGTRVSPDTNLSGNFYQQTNTGAKRSISLTPTRVPQIK